VDNFFINNSFNVLFQFSIGRADPGGEGPVPFTGLTSNSPPEEGASSMKKTLNRVRRCLEDPLKSWCRFGANERGNVLIEMGILTPFLVLLAVGTFDFGRLVVEQSGVTQAARAGAQFAVLDQGNAADTDGMIQAARNEAEDVDNSLVITARNFCRCPGSNAEVTCTLNCADGQYAPLFVEVSVTNNDFGFLVDYPGIGQSRTLNAVSTMRVR